MSDHIATICTLARQHGISLSEESAGLIGAHLSFVLEINSSVNLTSITDYEAALRLHIEDSLLAFHLFTSAPDGKYADIGCGGGFPGIPLAIATQRDTSLFDSSKKKIKVLNEFIQSKPELSNVSTFDIRLEQAALMFPENYSIVTARALSSLPSLLELACPLLSFGGYFIAYKARPSSEELNSGLKVSELLGFTFVGSYEFILSDDISQRTLLTFRKDFPSSIPLPRRDGLAQRKPLA